MEKLVVCQSLHPSLSTPPPSLTFRDQFNFRLTESMVAVLIYILHMVVQLQFLGLGLGLGLQFLTIN